MLFERVFQNIFRHRTKSVLTVLLSLLIVLFFFVYLSGLLSNISQYNNLGETLPVDGIVTNMTGKYIDDIRISPSRVQKLEKTGLITNVRKNTNLFFDPECRILNEDEAMAQFFQTKLMGINIETALPDFKEAKYMEGYSNKIFSSKEAVCLMEENYLEENSLKLGDIYKCTLYRKDYRDSEYSYKIFYTAEMEAKIVGSYNLSLSETSVEPIQIVTPIQFIRGIYREEDIKYTVHEMTFTLKNGFDLGEFKAQAKEFGFTNRNPLENTNDHIGRSLVLYDESFIKTSEQLQKNINLMQIFAPFVFIIVAFIGFLVSYLLMQSRRNEFAIMRSLGNTNLTVFGTILTETFILSLSGGLIGAVTGTVLLGISVAIAAIILGVFTLLYLLGALIALILLSRFSVMEVLTKT